MHYDEMIYRPPTEAYTLLLQVTSGCSHNKCTYCNMYEGVRFKLSPIDDIRDDLREASMKSPNTQRVYLLNGDPFVMSFEKLKEIAILIKQYLPKCETITMYASVNSVKDKTVEQLKELRRLGINELYFGIETGYDETLKAINKGSTSSDAYEQLAKLNEANMDFLSIIMYGVAGKGKGEANAEATAKLLSEVETIAIGPMNLSVLQGTQIYEQVKNGEFEEADELEKLKELRVLIQNLEVKRSTYFTCMHISNLVSLNGVLPNDKAKFLKELDTVIESVENKEIELKQRDFFGNSI